MWELSKAHDPLLVLCYLPEFVTEELLEQLSERFKELEKEERVKFVLANMEIEENRRIEEFYSSRCRLVVYKHPHQVAVIKDVESDILTVDYYDLGFQFSTLQEYR